MRASKVFVAVERGPPQPLERGRALRGVAGLEVAEAAELVLLLGVVGAAQLDHRRRGATRRRARNVLTPTIGSEPSCLRCS